MLPMAYSRDDSPHSSSTGASFMTLLSTAQHLARDTLIRVQISHHQRPPPKSCPLLRGSLVCKAEANLVLNRDFPDGFPIGGDHSDFLRCWEGGSFLRASHAFR